MIGWVQSNSQGARANVLIDGIVVGLSMYDTDNQAYVCVPVKKGQTVTTRSSYGLYKLMLYKMR
ncbi:hypothetical protein D5281_24825 [bacterium 1xD42-62]|uniref:Uncharacterized protein n=1 Tax=Parablautia muri TaxID=2320879 RepID=A0A9X5BL01_9FIRM|nr:hypothetical protein [Parablautia muri]